jgi:hypothetical protein
VWIIFNKKLVDILAAAQEAPRYAVVTRHFTHSEVLIQHIVYIDVYDR